MSWMEIPASSFEVVDARDMVSYNQVEVVVRHEDMLFHPPEGQWDRSAPLRILSFDIQAMVPPTPHRMPRYEHEGVLQIGNMLQIRGASHPYSRCIFTLDTCTEIAGAEVKSYETEEDLLLAWRDFVIAADPDLITGHEIACFDIPQLILRTWILELAEFPHLGRLKDIATTTVPQPFNYRKMKDAPVLPGRLQLDIWQYMVESKQSRTIRTGTGKPRCDLKTLAKEFFREKREDIVFTMIPALQLAGPDERQQLALHRLEDTHLPLKILQCPELRCLDESIEAARSSEEYMYCPFREFLRNGRN
ncbi:ribonuclease H-like domain-containing protein [Mycena latifolia]|nr:ribonuclease H-like domain-containing protein [Mycena latifolia]